MYVARRKKTVCAIIASYKIASAEQQIYKMF